MHSGTDPEEMIMRNFSSCIWLGDQIVLETVSEMLANHCEFYLNLLIEFVECEETTGEAICDAIVSSLAKLKLLPENCHAQTYDGAGNMCGKQKGCASRFQQLSPRALYIHCSSHQLNLALSKACSLPEIHCMLSAIRSVWLFFKYSPKRSRELESSITSLNEGRPNNIKVERHTSLEEFDEIYEALLICLEDISSKKLHSSWDKKTVIEASGLLTNITKPAFIAAFQCALFFFGFTKSPSIFIQGSSMDIDRWVHDFRATIVKFLFPNHLQNALIMHHLW